MNWTGSQLSALVRGGFGKPEPISIEDNPERIARRIEFDRKRQIAISMGDGRHVIEGVTFWVKDGHGASL